MESIRPRCGRSEARGDERVARLAQQLVDGLDARAHGRGIAAAVARIAADAGDLDGREARERLRQRERAVGRGLTRAVQADVQLDEQRRASAATLQRRSKPVRRQEAVDRNGQVHALGGDAGEALPLVGADGRVVHEDARRARLLEDLRLARLRDRQAAGAKPQLHEADLGGLVRLRVRPERDPVLVAVGLQIAEIGLEPVEIDHGHRRLDLPHRTSHLLHQQLERAIDSRAHRE